MEDKIEQSIDEMTAYRFLKEAKADFVEYHERYRVTGSKQDKFDLLLKYMEVAVMQAKKHSLKQDTN